MKVHHIGLASNNIEKDIIELKKNYSVISVSDIVYDPLQQVNLCLVTTDNGINFELVKGEKTDNLLKKGMNYYHVCYSVEDLDKSMEILKKNGGIIISQSKPAVLFNNRKVAFIYTTTGLIELLEE
jgi:methylmalonyl-CoA/ethylmalonyl-CoA epimerase